jgi:hypothetical protein
MARPGRRQGMTTQEQKAIEDPSPARPMETAASCCEPKVKDACCTETEKVECCGPARPAGKCGCR